MFRMAEPLIHHRGAEFRAVAARVNENLRYLFQTAGPVLTLTCSGTGGVEATFVSLCSPADTVIAVNAGKFGERWVAMPRALGLNAVEVKVPWGKAATADDLIPVLRAHPGAHAVYLTHSETSTGTALDIRSLASAVRAHSDALVCVDGISSVGALELRMDDWGVDVCVTGSQKGLMLPPGLAFVALGERAATAVGRSTMPRFYLDLRAALRSHASADTPWTPAIQLVRGADVALAMIREEGIERVWDRHRRLGRGFRAGVEALGLRLFSDSPSDAVTAVEIPGGVTWEALRDALRSQGGLTVAGGQGEYAGRIFRVAHLGYFDELDMITAVAALERALAACGAPATPGSGVAAAARAFAG